MIKTIMNNEDIVHHERLCESLIVLNTFDTNFPPETVSNCPSAIMSPINPEDISFSNEIGTDEACSIGENRKKGNFRQRIRSLREECIDGPLLASAEDIQETDDNRGFVVAHRNKRGKKPKELISKEILRTNVETSSPEPPSVETDSNIPRSLTVDQSYSENLLECLNVRYPDIKEAEIQMLFRMAEKEIVNFNDLSSDEMFEKLEKLKEKQHNGEDKGENTEKLPSRSGWCNVRAARTNRILDFDECSICFQSWDADDKKILECGHCFHADCIREWMKLKRTCPFCSTYSLSPDDFPKLT